MQIKNILVSSFLSLAIIHPLPVDDVSILDSDGDRTKAIILLHLVNGKNIQFVVPKEKLNDEAAIEAIIRQYESMGGQR